MFIVVAAIMLPMLTVHGCACGRMTSCVSNLKQVNLALRIWEGNNNNVYPMQDSTNIAGGKEWIEMGDVADCLRVASNELSTTRILICPEDKSHTEAKDFGEGFNNSHISYFLSPDARETYPQMILDGDDNFESNGVPVKSGLFDASTGASVTWGPSRHDAGSRIPSLGIPLSHRYYGNLGFADGSVAEESPAGLQTALEYATNGTPFMTNRMAIP